MKKITINHLRDLLENEYNSMKATLLHLQYQKSLPAQWRLEPEVTEEELDNDIKAIYANVIATQEILNDFIANV